MCKVPFYLSFLLLFFSCEETYVYFEDIPLKKAILGSSEFSVYSEKGKHAVIKESLGVDANYYYKCTTSEEKQFLVNTLYSDSNDKCDTVKWSKDENYFSFFIFNSTRYKFGHRLILFKVKNNTVIKTLDIRDRKFKNYFFEEGSFKFSYDNSIDTVTIKL